MITTIIFDLDGVLTSTRELHYEALNNALRQFDDKYVISRDEHLSTYDGLPTSKKLSLLTCNKNLPERYHHLVWKKKQDETIKLLKEMKPDYRIIHMLSELHQKGYRLLCASNSIRETLKLTLLKKGFLEFIDFYISNQDVILPKPHPQIYMKTMIKAGVSPRETLIIEDSHHGRRAALESGAHLLGVENPNSLNLEKIMTRIKELSDQNIGKVKWQGADMNILIPMAGAGSRFAQAGYTFPKPLIDINNKPMIQIVVENLNIEGQYIFIVQKEHYHKYNLKHLLNLVSPKCKIVIVDKMTEGAACTTLLAKEYINNDKQLVIANSDQFLEWDSNEFMYSMNADGIDAGLATFKSVLSKWSFAKLDDKGYVCEVAEKVPISDIANTGIHWFKKGSDYVKYAEQMIDRNIRVNNEFYVAPVLNQFIQDDKKIKTYNINKFHGLGDPESFERFLTTKISKKV